MAIQIKNNAVGYLDVAITTSDTGIALQSGDGAEFPSLTGGDYFYATIISADDEKEIVKVTARSGDSMTVTRAQESTTALAFAAGSRIELRVTKQNLIDAVAEYAATILTAVNSWSAAQTFDAVVNIFGGNKLRWYNSSDANPHGIRNNANVLTFDYNGSDYLTISTGGVFNFSAAPTIAGSVIYRAGGTDVPITDGGTGASTASDARTNLGLVIGSDVMAYNAAIADLAGQTLGADKLPYADGAASYAVTDFPAFGRTLVANASASDARSDLGLGSMSTQASNSVSITGGTVAGITDLQGRIRISPETSGTLTALSANTIVMCSGDVQIDASVFSQGDIIMFYSGSAVRIVAGGAGVTLRLGASSNTGDRSIAARAFVPLFFVSGTEAVLTGAGAA